MFMRCKIRIIFLFLFLLFLPQINILAQNTQFLIDIELLNAIKNEVSGERAWDMMSKISRFHRIRGGGEGSDYNRCVEWLAEELKKIGLENVTIKKFKADGFKKYFLWDSLVGWRVKEAELWLIEPEVKLMARYSNQAISLMPYSQGGETESEVVYVGEGKTDNDYKDLDVRGKLVFAIGGGGSSVHRQAVLKRGAVGIVVGPSKREARLQYPDLIELNRLSPSGNEIPKSRFGFSLSLKQEKELLSYFQSGRKVKMKAKVDAELIEGDMPVLEAVILGKEFPTQEIILMGHLDHYKPGANDNASGSAGMVEMARNIISLINRGVISPPKRTLRFLWLPEMHGAIAYLSEHQELKMRGIAGMNLDMIGEDYAKCQSNFNLTKAPYSVPGYINDILLNLLPWLESREFFSPRGSRHIFNYRVRSYSGGSDHVMFNDSSFSIPTPMLGHGDVFHHTNMDTPDKCDPTEMKRVTSLALASSLFLANASDKDAIKIAKTVHSQACLRMAERTQLSIHLLHQFFSHPEQRKDLAELFTNIIEYPDYHAEIEALNIQETKELCTKKTAKDIIEKLAKNLQNQAKHEKEKIQFSYDLLLKHYNLNQTQFHPSGISIEASSLKPKRLFKGPLPRNILQEKIGEENYAWYDKNRNKAGSNYGSKIYEIVNLMDGKRSLLDIRHIISCEFNETDIEFVLHFAKDLEKAGLIKF